MDRLKKIIFASLISTSAIAWLVSGFQQNNMAMSAMTVSANGSLDTASIFLFTAIWTAGMAAMMLPAISPMVLLYNRLIVSKGGQQAATVLEDRGGTARSYPLKTILFVGCYLVVWAATGMALLVGWTTILGNAAMMPSQQANIIYGAILIISGAYQFSSLKGKCLGYCESPMSFFMRRWKDGTFGAVKMGLYHGVYCLGCCWPYFLLMVALGWMNLLWMGLFAAIIFGEKIWNKGIWIARAVGAGLVIAGIFMLAGYGAALVRM